ncbi:hypothetical protein OEZ85_014378 [Tetradesmus obliquus]|uniref:Uncharacterized protein n=1 Tax=Tetradesmus obliquus TaxID=3088 RepID=A0ABY8UBT4_TETOB|nr:hypothetical protein OEZ85_014378 [Tetradesmus obliquus]
MASPRSDTASRVGLAGQSLARGMAAARILEARTPGSRSFATQRSNRSPTNSAREGSRSPRERSPPKSPRGAHLADGSASSSSSSRNLQLQPWQINAELITSSVEESRNSKLRTAPAGGKSTKGEGLLRAPAKEATAGVPGDTSAISAFVFGPAGIHGTYAHNQCPSDSCGSSAGDSSSYAVSCSSLGPSFGGTNRAGAAVSSEAGQLQQYGAAGGAGALTHRMSSGRRFSRQGSRMRQTSKSTRVSLDGDAGSATKYPVLFAPPPATAGTLGSTSAAHAAPGGSSSTADWRQPQLRSGRPGATLAGRSTAASNSSHRSGKKGQRTSLLPKVTPWANLEQQISERQSLQQQQLEKQLAVERRLAEQQALLKQQLEALRQMRSRSPSPMRGTTHSSVATSGGCSSVYGLNSNSTCGGRSAVSRSGSPSHHRPGAGSRAGRSRSPAPGGCSSAAAVGSSAVNVGDLLGSAGAVQHRSRHVTPQRSRRDDMMPNQQQQQQDMFCMQQQGQPMEGVASLAAAGSKKQLRAAAESLLTSLEHGTPMCPDALASLLGACNDPAAASAAAALAASTTAAQEVAAMQGQPGRTAAGVAAVLGYGGSASGMPVGTQLASPAQDARMQQQAAANSSNSSSSSSSTQPKKKPFVLVLPGHDTATPNQQQQQQQAIARSSSRSTAGGSAGSSTFKIPKGLLSLSFKKKSPKPPSQQRPKTYRAFYRQPGMSPKAPAVKYSSFKLSAKLLHPKLPNSPRLMLISPSSRFNSRRILAGLNSTAAQQAAADADPALPGVEGFGVEALAAMKDACRVNALAAAGMFRGTSSSSAGWSLRTQQSFAVSGEVNADAADEETAGTSAPNPAVLCATDSTAQLHCGLGSVHGSAAGSALAGLGSAAGAAAAAVAAAVAQAQAAAMSNNTASPAAGRTGGSPASSSPHTSAPASPKQPASPASRSAAAAAAAAAAGRRPGSASPSKPPAYVPVRRATADIAGLQRSSPVQGRTAGSQAAGAGGGYGKGAAAAAGSSSSSVAGPRRATVDAGSKGSLHMMSRNSYLQFLKHGPPDAAGGKASAAKGAASSPPAATGKEQRQGQLRQ